jgi:opacity protein-like surface antigen
MKRISIAAVLLASCLLLAAGEDRFFVSAGAAALAPADSRFTEIYGKMQVGPELRAGYNLSRNIFLWLGGSSVSAKGVVPLLGDETKASQHAFSLGAGWETRRRSRLQGSLVAALLLAGFREEAMGRTASKSALGVGVGAGLRYFLKQRIFLELGLDYTGARTTVSTEAGEPDIILGGFRLAGRLGFRF